MISLADAEKKTRVAQAEILRRAAAGEIPLAVWAHNWPAVPGGLSETSHKFRLGPSETLLRETWVFVDRGYLQKLINDPTTAVPMGTWRSHADGQVDLFVSEPNKPRIQCADLHVRDEDLNALKSSESARGTMDTEVTLANEVKERFWANWRTGQRRPRAPETRKFIEERAAALGIKLSKNDVKRIDAMARPKEIRDHFRRRKF
jgi:hypothetical protein